jgi:hypothetical protein
MYDLLVSRNEPCKQSCPGPAELASPLCVLGTNGNPLAMGEKSLRRNLC